MGIISAQMGVLLRKADATMTGIIMRTCAQNTVLALPSMKFMARSRPGGRQQQQQQQQQWRRQRQRQAAVGEQAEWQWVPTGTCQHEVHGQVQA
jgi:hypothetical protein